jgi:dTDP-4-amino-4,6-dideoxygalactose transaminase
VPLHSAPAGKKYGRVCGSMEQTDTLSERLVRLPLYYEMKQDDIARVCAAIESFYAR